MLGHSQTFISELASQVRKKCVLNRKSGRGWANRKSAGGQNSNWTTEVRDPTSRDQATVNQTPQHRNGVRDPTSGDQATVNQRPQHRNGVWSWAYSLFHDRS